MGWLFSRLEGSTKAMNLAAKNGYLQVVKWLHRNRSEGCTSNAIDFAAEKDPSINLVDVLAVFARFYQTGS